MKEKRRDKAQSDSLLRAEELLRGFDEEFICDHRYWKMALNAEIEVRTAWDAEAEKGLPEASMCRALATEAENLEILQQKLSVIIPELRNETARSRTVTSEVPLSLGAP